MRWGGRDPLRTLQSRTLRTRKPRRAVQQGSEGLASERRPDQGNQNTFSFTLLRCTAFASPTFAGAGAFKASAAASGSDTSTPEDTLNFKLIFIPSMSHRVLVLWCPNQAHAYLWHPSAAACFCLCGLFQFAHTYRRSEAVEPSHVIAALEHFLTTSPLSHLCLSVSPAAKTEDLTPRETRQVSHSIPGKW